MKILLENGADVNTRDNLGHTPFMSVAMASNKELLTFLIENGADWTIASLLDLTPFQWVYNAKTYTKDFVIWFRDLIDRAELCISSCRNSTLMSCLLYKCIKGVNKDVAKIIAKMVWRTRRQLDVWGRTIEEELKANREKWIQEEEKKEREDQKAEKKRGKGKEKCVLQ